MFTVQSERATQSVGGPSALMLGVIAALAITAFTLAVPHTRHPSRAPRVIARCAAGCLRGGRAVRRGMPAATEPRAGGRYLRAAHSYGAVP